MCALMSVYGNKLEYICSIFFKKNSFIVNLLQVTLKNTQASVYSYLFFKFAAGVFLGIFNFLFSSIKSVLQNSEFKKA